MPETGPRSFQTTRWSLVLAAGGGTNPPSFDALSELCRLYQYPVYAFIRRTGKSAEDAEDLQQGFFADLLERRDIATANRERGRFRTWLLACVKHYLANQHDFASAAKRGGGQPILSLDAKDSEGRYLAEPTDDVTPEKLYLRSWINVQLDRVMNEMRAEKAQDGKRERFELFQPFLVDEGETRYSELARTLSQSENKRIDENAVKQAIHRLREEYRARCRREIGGTVATEAEIDEEILTLWKELG